MLVNCLTATRVNRLTAKLVVVNLVKLHLTKFNCTRCYLVSNGIRWRYSLDNVIEPVRNSYVLNDIALMDDM